LMLKQIKLIVLIVLLGLVAVVFFQNRQYFLTTQALRLDLLVTEFETAGIYNWLYFLVVFLAGLVIGYAYGFFERYKLRKKCKRLKQSADQPVRVSDQDFDSKPDPAGSGSHQEKGYGNNTQSQAGDSKGSDENSLARETDSAS